MTKGVFFLGLLSVTLAAPALGQTPARSPAPAPTAICDRSCLKRVADNYIAAMLKHDVAAVNAAPSVTVTENTRSIKLGEGVFSTATKLYSAPSQTQYVMDTVAGEVGYLGIISDKGEPAFYALRLKVVGGRVTEIETLLTKRGDGSPFWPEGYLYREAPYIRDVPLPVRTPRARLAEVAEAYWRVGGTTHNGSTVPYTEDCVHFQNGMNTDWERPLNWWEEQSADIQASDGRIWTCAREVDLTTLKWTKTRDMHYLIDEERGLVMSWQLADTDPAKSVKSPATQSDGSPWPPRSPDFYGPPSGPGPNGLDSPPTTPSFNRRTSPFTMYHAVVMRVVGSKIQREQVFQRELDAGAGRSFAKGPLDSKQDFSFAP